MLDNVGRRLTDVLVSTNFNLRKQSLMQNRVLLTLMLRLAIAYPCATAQQPRRLSLRLTFYLLNQKTLDAGQPTPNVFLFFIPNQLLFPLFLQKAD